MREMKVPPIVTILCVVAAVVGLGFFAYHSAVPPQPTAKLTPGVPPWEDPQYKGKLQPGQAPNNWQPPAPSAWVH
jgi:hypothetical protein